MLRRLMLLVVCAGVLSSAQARLTVEQLKEFVRSSVALKHPDRKLAEYLKKIKLSNQLDDATIEELQGLGAGPLTVAALKALGESTAALPKAPPPAVKPVYVPPATPTSEEQARVLQAAKEYALNYSARIPDFICTQVTRRFVDPSGMEFWRASDVIQERLSYFEGHEDYKVVLYNNSVVEMSHDKLGGATSSGEFASMMKEIFNPQTEAIFDWERWGTLRGRRMHVFSYKVLQSRSKYSILAGSATQAIIAGYHGLIYVDRETNTVLKITLQADDLPAGFPIREVNLSLDYDHVSISDHDFILPLKAVLTSREGAKFMIKNEVEFRMYRKFSAESTITSVDVQAPDALPAEATKEQPAGPPAKTPEKNKP
jgi:hypothetical protein